jgi:hypothetical protein
MIEAYQLKEIASGWVFRDASGASGRHSDYEPYFFSMVQDIQVKGIQDSNIIRFNCASLVCLNKNKQNGSHNTPLRELGCDQFSPLQVLRPSIWIKYTSLFGLVMVPQLCIDLLS